jgi:cobalamin-dependent methionine synthase I
MSIAVLEVDKELIIPNKNELSSRLGAPKESFGESFLSAEREVISAMTPRLVYSVFPIIREGNLIKIDRLETESVALSKCLLGYDEAVLLALTLGMGVDRLILGAEKLSAERAFIIDAVASAYAEALCDYAEEYVCRGRRHGKRYSIGYGDLPIEKQKTQLSILDSERKIGLYILESSLMKPEKSITAIIGVSSSRKEFQNEEYT